MPCNFHHRALAAKVKEGIKAAGGTPMEFNTIAISDGITMGTSGMRASLISREVIADSIELVGRGHLFDAVDRDLGLRQDDPRHGRWRSRGSTCPSVMLYGGSIPPGHFQGKNVTIQEVFEAVGAHAAGKMTDEELHELEGRREPRPRRLRRPVHRQHDGDGVPAARHQPDRPERRPRAGPDEGAGGLRRRRAGHGRARPRPAPERDHHQATRSRTRSPRVAMSGGSTNARPAPARGRPRGGHRARASTTSTASPPRRRCCATSSRSGASSPPTCTPPAAPPVVAQPCRGGAARTRTRSR